MPLASADSWEDIGIGLRLKVPSLEEIGKFRRGRRMSEVVRSWLKREYNVKKFGEPSWRALVQVVANPAAGNDPKLALKIARKHPGNFHV